MCKLICLRFFYFFERLTHTICIELAPDNFLLVEVNDCYDVVYVILLLNREIIFSMFLAI